MRVKLAIKLLVTALLLWMAFRAVDLSAIPPLLASFNPLWAAAALFLTLLIVVADGLLLVSVLRVFDQQAALRTAMLYSLVGWFFSNVAPSTVGGDIFRGVQLSRAGIPVGTSVRAVLAIRLLSLSALVIVMLAGVPIALRVVEDRAGMMLLGATLAAAISALFVLYSFPTLSRRISLVDRWRLLERLRTVSADFRQLISAGGRARTAWIEATVQHLLRVGVLAALAAALGLGINLATLFALTPAALLIAMVPISLGGWGVRELSFVYLLGTAGVDATAALALSVAFGLLRIVVGALGGLAWVIANDDHFRVAGPPA